MSSENIQKIIPVILAGGTGSRLWPLSRKSFPKQFLNLLENDEYTMLQRTYKRIENLEEISKPIVICNEEHRFIVSNQMKEINIEPLDILLEPEGRNTTAAVTIAALKALDIFKNKNIEPILLILPSDHQIKDVKSFELTIKNSIELALQDNLVTFGVLPTYPATGYGYIKSEKVLDHNAFNGIRLNQFVEKPDKKTAKLFLKDKKYSWNSGMFFFKATTILDEIKNFAPEVLIYCEKCLDKSKVDLDFLRLEEKSFKQCENISIDISIFEKTKKAFVMPLNCGWNDIGNWESLWEMSKKDLNGNYFDGKILAEGVQNSMLKSKDKLVVGIDLENIIVVETKDAVLIANKNSSEKVKNIVTLLSNKGFDEANNHKKVYRPWGVFTSIEKGENWQIKKIEVNPGASLSLQMHFKRSEHWVVVNGTAKIEIDDTEKIIGANESVYIPLGAKHRLSNPTKLPLTLIEIQSGSYLGEDDIVRFKDIYNR